MNWKPDFFWIGPPKSASTWAHRCFREHPEIFVPEQDYVRYFDVHYHRGEDWYKKHFEGIQNHKVVGECTPTYLTTQGVAELIYKFNKDAKIIVSLRNPIDRAFSHYWHLKKRGRIGCEFNEIFDIPNFFRIFVRSGFYYNKLKVFFDYFSENQIKVMIFDDLQDNEKEFISEVFQFLKVDPDFEPSVIGEKVNRAGLYQNLPVIIGKKALSCLAYLIPGLTEEKITRSSFYRNTKELLLQTSEYEKGMSDDMRQELREVYKNQNRRLSQLLSRKVPEWT